jgi:tetratricopeptide (TPR) repeat protein
MKNLLCIYAFQKCGTNESLLQSLSDIQSPREVFGSLPFRKSCRKWLIIKDYVSHPTPKLSGNVRFSPFTAPTYPEPIRSNPKLCAEAYASGLTELESLNGNPVLNRRHNSSVLAPTCINLRQPAPTCGKRIIYILRLRCRKLAERRCVFHFLRSMKRQRLVPKGTLSRLFEQAAEAWRHQAYDKTIELLERASRLDPANASVLIDLGRAYGLRYQYEAAERCLEKGIRVAPQKAEALAEAGRRAQEFGHYDLAKAYFERAAKEKSASADVLVTLAELYERAHELDASTAMIAQALARQADHPSALLAQARLQRLAGELEVAERLTRVLLEKPACDPQTRIRAWYELGLILDRQGRFDEAMAAFLEAKALQRPAATQPATILQGVQARVTELRETISSSVLERWQESTASLGPPRRLAVLCGHPRSGTTLLEQVLDAHPDIVSAEETHILHDEAYLPLSRGFPETASVLQVLDAAAPSQLQRAREDYFRFNERFLRRPIEGRWLIDKNPALTVLIPAVIRIFPEAKFLFALRDPRDVCLSCFMQYLRLNPVASAYLTLEGTVQQYASVMGLWLALLPRMKNQSLEVRYEDVVTDLEAVARSTLEFLGEAWDARVLRFYEHARSKPVRSPTYADVTRPVYGSAVGRWRNYRKHLGPYLEGLDTFVQKFGYK